MTGNEHPSERYNNFFLATYWIFSHFSDTTFSLKYLALQQLSTLYQCTTLGLEFGGPHGECRVWTYNRGSGVRAPSGVQEQSPWSGDQRAMPPKLNFFLHCHNTRSRPLCHEMCFCRTKTFHRTSGGPQPTGSVSDVWMKEWMKLPILVCGKNQKTSLFYHTGTPSLCNNKNKRNNNHITISCKCKYSMTTHLWYAN